MTLRVLLVDDEAPARRKLRAHLAAEQDVEVVGEAGTGPEAVEAIRRLKPDVVFLDVQMPGLGGFQVLEEVGLDEAPAVVFVTAFDEFAVDAFEVEAVDYLLKPFHADRFRKALARVRERLSRPGATRDALERVLKAVRPDDRRPLERLLVREGERMFFVPLREVARLTAEGNYVRVVTAKGSHLVRETLAGLEARLDPARFARVHRSEIVAVEAVAEIQPLFHGDHEVVLRNGDRVRMSRRYQDRLLGT